MSNEEYTDQQQPTLVPQVDEFTSTDNIQEFKSGIFSLFVTLYNHMSTKVGPVEAMKYCILYLQEIINNFQTVLDGEENNK
jgi:hypothetical protein